MSADNNHREVKHTLCRMCADRCGVNLYLENGRIVDIDGFKDYPVNKGRMCVKGRAAQDLVYHPDRLLKPLKKTDHGWQEIPLEQALDEIAVKIKKVQQQYGERAVSVWKGEAVGFAQQEDIARRFIHAIGSPNYFSNDTACWVGKYIGYCLGYGQWQMGDYPQAKLIMLWGVNPPYSMATMMQDIMKGRENGAKMIVIDPRLSAVARQADIYVQLRPGTDGALALGLANLLISSNRYDRDFISRFTVGFDKFAAYVKKFTPEYVSAETSVPVAVIHEIADIMAAAAPQIAFHCGNGLEHHINGVNNVRAVSMLDALNGCLDTPGGTRLGEGPGLRGLTLYDEIPLRHLEPIGSTKYPVFYDFRQECHTMMSMDTMLTDKPYPLKAMLLTAANPVLSNPNTDKVKKALASLDLLVVRDLFMTETAELADYVLPAASFLEREELHSDSYQQILAITNKIHQYPEVQDEYQFWHDMAHRLGAGKWFPWENEMAMNRWMLEPTGITVEMLQAHPEGIRYKPIRYYKHHSEPLTTPSGKVEMASQYLKDYGFDELPEYHSPSYITNPDPAYPLVMMSGARFPLYVHGKFRNIPRFRTAIPNAFVELNPVDAAKMGIEDGEIVRVISRINQVEVAAKIMAPNEIIGGSCQFTHGWKDADVNKLTIDDEFDPIDGFPKHKSVPVRIEKLAR